MIMELFAKLASGLSTVDSLAIPLERVNGVVVAFIKWWKTIPVSVYRITNVPKVDPAYIDSSPNSFFSLFHFTPCKDIHGSSFTFLLFSLVCHQLCLCCIHGNQRLGNASSSRFKMLSNMLITQTATEHATFRAVRKTYHYDRAFAAKDYETYIHTSALQFQPLPPSILHQAGYSSPRHVIDKPCSSPSTELLVSGPALAFIVVLILGAFMFWQETHIYLYIIIVLYPSTWIHPHHCL